MARYVWYPRLAEVPGMRYETPPGIDRAKLPGVNTRPVVREWQFEGRMVVSPMWGNTSQAPCRQHVSEGWDRVTSQQKLAEFLRVVQEGLELPGTVTDYHFLLLNAQTVLWSNRRQAAWAFIECERFCWLDILLIESNPDADADGDRLRQLGQSAYGKLISLYTREGYLYEALNVAERGAAILQPRAGAEFNQAATLADKAAEIRARIEAIEARNSE